MNAEMSALMKERLQTNFNVEELTNLLDGGVAVTERRRKFGNYEVLR